MSPDTAAVGLEFVDLRTTVALHWNGSVCQVSKWVSNDAKTYPPVDGLNEGQRDRTKHYACQYVRERQ
jgi:hypothetical protein